MDMALTIISIVLGLGAIGGVLLFVGRFMAEQDQSKKDIDGVSRKVDHIRKDLKEEINDARGEHRQLDTKVDELVATTAANNTLLSSMNVTMHLLLDAAVGK